MRNFLLALPLASFLALAGCTTDDGTGSAAALSTPEPVKTATVTQAPAAAQQPVMQRRSTTQPLPAGYGYLNEKELGAQTPIKPAAPAAVTSAKAPTAVAPAATAPAPALTTAKNG